MFYLPFCLFIIDSVIGNFDRHTGNWGYIAEIEPVSKFPTKFISNAPVYDCGSSFSPRLSEEGMQEIYSSTPLLLERALTKPRARLIVGERGTVNFFDHLMSDEGLPARQALLRLSSSISDMKIGELAFNVPGASLNRSRFYAASIYTRCLFILQPAYEAACRESGLPIQSLLPSVENIKKHEKLSLEKHIRKEVDNSEPLKQFYSDVSKQHNYIDR